MEYFQLARKPKVLPCTYVRIKDIRTDDVLDAAWVAANQLDEDGIDKPHPKLLPKAKPPKKK